MKRIEKYLEILNGIDHTCVSMDSADMNTVNLKSLEQNHGDIKKMHCFVKKYLQDGCNIVDIEPEFRFNDIKTSKPSGTFIRFEIRNYNDRISVEINERIADIIGNENIVGQLFSFKKELKRLKKEIKQRIDFLNEDID